MKNIFIAGPILPEKIAESIAKHQVKTTIGAHDIFLGQVRADKVGENIVAAIEYSAYEPMVNQVIHEIREEVFAKYELSCLHIYHAIGLVKAGEICLFVFTSSKHRKMAMDATRFLVESIKAKAPIFGKEIFEDMSHQWKVNQ
ncbi:molybdenum cofactor biosynthesis protein MoaE [Putridiphycobacter roseus]|uniref:Molybdopterin synthase catalytic subunit n=1 Tax=Putridiphycobacter roseus TaxID=2219161 RepID=A0A2W1N2B3_9FLAO|nr:molybdenum cofactor biosynthesis protein MoaE [Putridiphycobacter roseus]PZE17101.1 molybdenum cofactor biosynthesis protein MoaE [Putridiphycobacter roseus]